MKKKQKGQSLVEVAIALVILGIIMTALSRTIISSLKNVEYSRNENYSLHLAQAKMEEIRNERDSQNWLVFWDSYLKEIPEKELAPEYLDETGDNLGNYKRVVKFIDKSVVPPDLPKTKMEVIVSVSWQEASAEHTSSVSAYLTKWK